MSSAAWVEAQPRPFWLDSPLAPAPADPFAGEDSCPLAVVGGGFTGLWAALQAKQDDPARDVVVLEAATVAAGASGRNGGFTDASLTHGLANGLSRFPDEIDQLEAGLKRYPLPPGESYSWDAYIRKGLRGVPADPEGIPYEIDPATGRVSVSQKSRLFPLPDDTRRPH